MKSGLEDRNNNRFDHRGHRVGESLNEVRPGRPEQYDRAWSVIEEAYLSQ